MWMALPVAPARAATLTADYTFQNTYASSAGSAPAARDFDPTGTDAPDNGFASEVVMGVDRTVLGFPEGNGVELSTQGVIPNDSYTIAVLFRSEMDQTWSRLLEFKNMTQENGVYVTSSGSVQLYPVASGPPEAISTNDYAMVVLTRDANDNVVAYVNGVEHFTYSDTGDLTVIDPAANLLQFFVDAPVGVQGEHSAGAVARIRLWDGPLTASEVANLDDTPPPNDPRCTSNPSAGCGGPGDDDLVGTPEDDVIFAGGGNDTVETGAGNDTVAGDAGDDTIDTGSGNDTANGGSGHDRVLMAGGKDLAKGGAGNDLLQMADGLDKAVGGGGRDVIEGGAGFDDINGGKGFDICFFSSRKEKKAMKGCEEKRPDKRAH
jgi:hypothetical protein